MNFYMNEDSSTDSTVAILRKPGHDVQSTNEAGHLGHSDVLQMLHAIHANRIVITRNRDDFISLDALRGDSTPESS